MKILKQTSKAELAIQQAEQILRDANVQLFEVQHVMIEGAVYELQDISTGSPSQNFPRLVEEERFVLVETE